MDFSLPLLSLADLSTGNQHAEEFLIWRRCFLYLIPSVLKMKPEIVISPHLVVIQTFPPH